MSALRFAGRIIGGFFFTTFLTLVIFMLAISHYTAYSNLKPIVVNLVKEKFTPTPEELNLAYASLSYQCNTTKNETIYFELPELKYFQTLELKCSDISATTPSDLPELVVNTTFNKIYFKNYDCSFFRCIQLPEEQKFLFLMSKQANEFFEKTIIYLYVATALSAFILVASAKTWSGKFKAVGISLIFVGVFYFLIPLMRGYMEKQLPQQIFTKVSPTISQVLDSISSNLLIVFIVGVVLTTGFFIGYLARRKENGNK
jgi:hypothetical protein